MLKYIRMAFQGEGFTLLHGNHVCKKFLKHKEKYSLEERCKYVRQLAQKVNRTGFNCNYYITGEEYLKQCPGQVFFVSNHNGTTDPISFLTFGDRPISFLAKIQIKKMPIFGHIVSSLDASFIDREDLRSEIKVFQQTTKLLKENPFLSFVAFPEGTRSKGPEFKIAPFKGGTFKIATRLELPIIPVATYLNARVLDQRYHYRRYPVQVEYLKPILPEEYENMSTSEIAALAQSRIEEAVARQKAKDLELIMEANHYSEKKARKVQLCPAKKEKHH